MNGGKEDREFQQLIHFPSFSSLEIFFIQPPGTVHAPYSPENVLMSGTFHWSSRDMATITEKAFFSARYPETTNEPQTKEYKKKLEIIDSAWVSKTGGVQWSSEEDMLTFRDWHKKLKTCKPYAAKRNKKRR
ncbi:hypothetical protein K458DRAFT_434231 [Lentithecium fluviatile CBS 122367]|uniref:JmjC domain-containing protein n=1 Tax=Lentithecium fluviatile CBS 122367 TaxID=1168545 RepID=A0A6G1IR54_9PLEO|nr:hypothetical protein K458DRAFT_434231 [Lentithecium fluviatile CBS 122367]